ncbi:MAG TPA: hypothetical protein VF246_06635 [Acidimicrobiia bacterium]
MKRHIPLLLTLLLVSACTARSEIHVIFDSASSGAARVVTAGDSLLREAMASDFGGTPDWGDLEFVVEAFEGQELVEEGFEMALYEDGDFVGVEATKRFSSLDELARIMRGPDAESDTGLTFVSEEKTISLNAPDFVGEITEEEAGFGEFLTIELNLHVKLPGTVTSHNATRVADDGTLVWEYRLDGSSTDFAAPEASAELTGSGLPVIVMGAVVALAAIAFGLLWSRRRGENGPGSDDAAQARAGGPIGVVTEDDPA